MLTISRTNYGKSDINDTNAFVLLTPPPQSNSTSSSDGGSSINQNEAAALRNLVAAHPPRAGDSVVCLQLQKLAMICDDLSDPKKASPEALLDLSWGIGSLPKEKKFSAKWSAVIANNQWMLLEDISSQIKDLKGQHNEARIWESVQQFSKKGAEVLKNAFINLANLESGLQVDAPQEPCRLSVVEDLFISDFDNYVFEQIQSKINIILASMGSQDPKTWLTRDKSHVKALFRTIEVIGEATKILGKEVRQAVPMFSSDQDTNFWGKLRDQLHHNKMRCWEIAHLAPEKWTEVIDILSHDLLDEISNYKNHQPHQGAPDLKSVKSLCDLCGDDQFSHAREKWKTLSRDFALEPIALKRILFGIDDLAGRDFTKIWQEYAKPFLKSGVNESANREMVFEILRFGQKALISENDIRELIPESRGEGKAASMIRMLELLEGLTLDNKEKFIKSFDALVNKFVFLKMDGGRAVCDGSKYKEFDKIISEKIRILKPFEFTKDFFTNPDGTFTEYGKLRDAYIKLKYSNIKDLISHMKRMLYTIKASWPDDLNNLEKLISQGSSKFDAKALFLKDFYKLIPEKDDLKASLRPFVHLENVSAVEERTFVDLTKRLKVFSYNPKSTKQLSVDQFRQSRQDCFAAVDAMLQFLETIKYSEDHIRQYVEDNFSKINAICAAKPNSADELQKAIKKVESIFQGFAFKGNFVLQNDAHNTGTGFVDDLRTAGIEHDFDDHTPSLNSLRMRVVSSLNGDDKSELRQKLANLVDSAEKELSDRFVQNALTYNQIDTPEGSKRAFDNMHLLKAIYERGLDASSPDYKSKLEAWETIERKKSGRKLSAKNFNEVKRLFPDDLTTLTSKQCDKANTLLDYLDGSKDFPLNNLPRHKHGTKKVEVFMGFMEEFSKLFPALVGKRDEIIAHFKTANGIVDDQHKVQRFVSSFERKIARLGEIFSKILDIEKNQNNQNHNQLELLLLGAEYDLQDIGELAQLITERPSFWNHGRNILSSHHLHLISLLRKMMAHYPLSLPQDVVRWNLEYLAFDTKKMMNRNGLESYALEERKAPSRKPMTRENLNGKIFEIENHLNRLNLKTEHDILYPSQALPELGYLHPLGELSLMVHPDVKISSKEEFTHSVMQLESILNYDLDTKVSVIGLWENELVNIPSEKNIPDEYLKRVVDHKQGAHRWIKSAHSYDLYRDDHWTQIVFKSGRVVSRTDHEHHKNILFFLKTLEMPLEEDALQDCVNRSDLKEHIFFILKRLSNEAGEDYPNSTLYRWIRCLFESFCPAGVTPNVPISIPPADGDDRPCFTMLDSNLNGLAFLDESSDTLDAKLTPYYRADKQRLDVYDGLSLLDSSYGVTNPQLRDLATYASRVLKAHIHYIQEKLNPEYGLDKSLFCQIEQLRYDDPALAAKPSPLATISPGIQQLINLEASELATDILGLVRWHANRGLSGKAFCKSMLDCMAVEKEIAEVARAYYGKNRMRLKGPYIKMDRFSKQIFHEFYLTDVDKWRLFPFVVSFRKFLDRIHFESENLTVMPWSEEIRGDFSDQFKRLVPEIDERHRLLSLMKERKKIASYVAGHYTNYMEMSPFEDITYRVNEAYTRWDRLFRMVNRKQVFELLSKEIDNLASVGEGLASELRLDFEAQYKIPPEEQEDCIAKFGDQREHLYPPRVYFEQANLKAEVNRFQRQITGQDSSNFKAEWKKVYGEEFESTSFPDPIGEAKKLLTSLINFSSPNNSEDASTYSKYWNFVNRSQVEMIASASISGIENSLKSFILDGGKLEAFSWYTENRANEKFARTCKILEAYVPFLSLEDELSDLSNKLKLQVENFDRQSQERARVNDEQTERWEISRYDTKLINTRILIKDICARLKICVEKASQSEFFKMLKLYAAYQNMINNHRDLPDAERCKKALESLICGHLRTVPQTLRRGFEICGIPPGENLAPFC